MPLVVNSNISSLNAQRQLLQSGMELDKASERLASGRRINSAADDAAGLAISNRQTSQIRGLDQAIRNANDGVSLIQTAEGALDETTNILQRMRELAIQSSNGIYSDTDRATLDAEVQQLKAEIDRIAETTSFNGQNILDGTLGDVSLQVGSDANQTISFTVGQLDADNLGGAASADIVGTESAQTVGGAVADLSEALNEVTGAANLTLTINDQDVGDLTDATVGATLEDKLSTINEAVSGVEASAFVSLTADSDGNGVIRGTDYVQLAILRQDGTTTTLQVGDTGSMEEFVDKVNELGGADIEASLNDDGRLVLSSSTAETITVTESGVVSADAIGVTTATAQQAQLELTITDDSVDNIDVVYGSAITADMSGDIGLQARTDGNITGATAITANSLDLVEGDMTINGVEIGAVTGSATLATQLTNMVDAINLKSADHGVVATSSGTAISLNSVDGSEISIEFTDTLGTMDEILTAYGLIETNSSEFQGNAVSDVDISTEAGAQAAIEVIDTALEQINTTRSELGAVNNRLDFTVSNLSNVSEKTSAARSRIVDADFAAETAQLSRAQVLQQASQAMLAQANARPQQVLSLLQ
ncbi:flagellin [Agaribacterium haliotis]|uniref:flagellin N-terminal helical domain-containing protein n=1 Tax=Agaribacterium haliotis TaxID=2013869 RepID=UPI000BB557A6|nr:flagellin [Agaribacterium haliotis]